MPPKKTMKLDSGGLSLGNPRVVLKPFRADTAGHSRYKYSSQPPITSLFKQHTLSDIKLCVGDQQFYAHRLVLAAASPVFARMFEPGGWAEHESKELQLHEEPDCVKIFERFLYFFYAGSIVISDTYVIPLYMLADKYDVKPLYDECVKVIIGGLKVYFVRNSSASEFTNTTYQNILSSSDNWSSTSDAESSDDDVPAQASPTLDNVAVKSGVVLAASETFPLAVVIKMLMYCQNDDISSAALYNVESRLARQIDHGNMAVWNELEVELLVRLLQDTNFYCAEFTLFQATCSWLRYSSSRQQGDTPSVALTCIRYPTLTAQQLYEVETEPLVKTCNSAVSLVQEAIRYQLFRHCSKINNKESWSGSQFTHRQVKPH